jgi:hypothetical protein
VGWKIRPRRTTDDPFPLTLALSLREREKLSTLSDIPMFRLPAPRCDLSKRSECAPKWHTILPLPVGEGRGEGLFGFEPFIISSLRLRRKSLISQLERRRDV